MSEINEAIGGYFGLETNQLGTGYHDNSITINSGRNALEYILTAREYNKVYIPYFTCEVILEPIIKLKIEYEFYSIDTNLEPLFDYKKVKEKHGFLYTNYFGIKDVFITKLVDNCQNLIIDNAQSFFSKPIVGIDTFYSPRKFLGVSDGAYLFCEKKLNKNFKKDESFNRMSHLLIRADMGPELGYSNFITNDKSLINQPIKRMSNLTSKILSSINYEEVKKNRINNFEFLQRHLGDINIFKVETNNTQVPMVYPYWSRDKNLRQRLFENKVYTPTYWANVKNWCKEEDLEKKLTDEVVYLPIDQRYGKEEMNLIINIIKEGL